MQYSVELYLSGDETLEGSQLEMWVTTKVSGELGIQGKQSLRENSDRSLQLIGIDKTVCYQGSAQEQYL